MSTVDEQILERLREHFVRDPEQATDACLHCIFVQTLARDLPKRTLGHLIDELIDVEGLRRQQDHTPAIIL